MSKRQFISARNVAQPPEMVEAILRAAEGRRPASPRPDASDLNVGRLIRAFMIVQPGLYGQDWPRDDPDDFQFVNPREHAEAIAAEYARLSETVE